MALEPVAPTTAEEVNPELVDMRRRFWGSLALTVPVLVLAMGEMIPGNPLAHTVSGRALAWIQVAFATPVVLWGGWPFFVRSWISIRTRHLNMFTLIALGTGTAWLYSLVATVVPEIFPASFRGTDGEVAVYFEAAAVIVTLRQVPRFERCSAWLPGPRAASRKTVPSGTCRSKACTSGTACGSGQARRSPSTASSSRVRAPWTSR
jgi:cation transport ATPase